jgi:hypothetical protein
VKQVFVAQHPIEAHFVKGLLESNGITAEVYGESLFNVRGETPATPDTLPSVWVDENETTKALDVLAGYGRQEANATNQGAAWTCPACRERIESQFTECWHCGAGRPRDTTE